MHDDPAARSATPQNPSNFEGRDFSALTGQVDPAAMHEGSPLVGPSATGNLVGADGTRLATGSPWPPRVITALTFVGIAGLMVVLLLGQGLGWFSRFF